MMHHTGVMERGAQRLAIAIVSDSGTDELAGVEGTMTIEIKDKKHTTRSSTRRNSAVTRAHEPKRGLIALKP